MLSKNKRLSTQQFDTAFSAGALIRTPHFAIRHLPSPTKTQWAVVVPKKHIRTAVGRNALRRKIYSAIENLSKEQNTFAGHYIIILSKPFVATPAEIQKELGDTLTRRSS
ncbi:MAG: ribonuclease P protein component [Candidatus Campbellbacteria bacterium]|nr:ribonuclease P protein component [Candidatus Campbellbacteria bacterium]